MIYQRICPIVAAEGLNMLCKIIDGFTSRGFSERFNLFIYCLKQQGG